MGKKKNKNKNVQGGDKTTGPPGSGPSVSPPGPSGDRSTPPRPADVSQPRAAEVPRPPSTGSGSSGGTTRQEASGGAPRGRGVQGPWGRGMPKSLATEVAVPPPGFHSPPPVFHSPPPGFQPPEPGFPDLGSSSVGRGNVGPEFGSGGGYGLGQQGRGRGRGSTVGRGVGIAAQKGRGPATGQGGVPGIPSPPGAESPQHTSSGVVPAPVVCDTPPPTPVSLAKNVEKLPVSTKSQDAAAAALEKLSFKQMDQGLKPPLRKSVGTSALCKYTVETNHLPLTIKLKEVIHYDVNIEPDKPKKFMKFVMRLVQQKCYPRRLPAFDGKKNLYSSGPLDFGPEMATEVVYHDSERNMDLTYKVTIKFAARVDMSCLESYMVPGRSTVIPQRQLQAIDVVLRSAPSFRFTPVGRSYFTQPTGVVHDLTGGMELWYGFYQSAILGWKPYVNVDVAHKGFPKAQPCLTLIQELCPRAVFNRKLEANDEETLSKFLKGLKVNYEIPGVANSKRTYKVNGLKAPANVHRFSHDGTEMTVEEYYRIHKGFTLRCPNFQLLHLGSIQKEMYMPLELCSVAPGQVVMRKLNENQTSKMIRHAATPADVRKNKIMDALNQASFNRDPTLKEFGISVGQNFEKVEARILPAPGIRYGGAVTAEPWKGVWNPKPLYNGADLLEWAVLTLDSYVREDEIEEFISQMFKACRNLGMKISQPLKKKVDTRRQRPETWLDFDKNQKFQIIVVVVSDFGGQYGKVKQMAELKLGVLTQCVRGQTIKRLKPATTSNILLKINSKLNGINHVINQKLPCFQRPIMIVGADVTHPSPDAKEIPSAAAVAASFDANAYRYAIQYRLQPPRVEVIEDMANVMRELLLSFFRINKLKPEKIVVFRDGVSDGQFAAVLNSELLAIRKACSMLEADYKPPITFLVVQKRHHTRFFPTANLPRDFMDQRNKNVPAGTIVDTKITHPTELDFYLVSHASIQGTSRPTKYHLLWDDSGFSTDELEAMTYHLCHLFSRCTRSVSYPAPTYYAHLAAFRARVYLEDGKKLNMADLNREQKMRSIQTAFAERCPMFFV